MSKQHHTTVLPGATCASRTPSEIESARKFRTCSLRSLAAACAVSVLAMALPAMAAAVPARLRGNIIAIDGGTITVKERDGRTFTLRTGPDTTYANVVPSRLDAIKLNDFIGTASKGPAGDWRAVEIVIIPESMRAGRKGYASWDALPDTAVIRPAALVATTMTNGVVVAAKGGAAGRTLSVSLDGNKTVRITVPPTAPIVRFVPTSRSAMAVGATVFVKTNGDNAALVAAGKGVIPPM